MNQKVQQSLESGIQFLAKHQQSNGSFKGQASKLADDFSQPVGNDNVFFTALILQCLVGIDGAEAICGQAANYLLKQRTANWAWNYWAQGSISMQERAYPDDLDDTACAVSAILAYNPKLITAAGQANTARNLISCEVQTGGPYITWLEAKSSKQWADVDIAVNANIGHMLAGLGAHSSALEQYIEGCLQSGELSSPYYIGIVPTLYFLARWYNGPAAAILQNKILEELAKSKTILHTAMLLSSAIKQGLGEAQLQSKIDVLLSEQNNGHWPAEALYYEPPQQGHVRYAGSAELTTAFVIEALKLWAEAKPKQPPQRDSSEIDNMAGVFAAAGNWQLDEQILELLNAANKLGWQAYTIYDDFLDDDGQPADLPRANKAHRQAVMLFKLALNKQKFSDYVDRAFDAMDDANYWEVTSARDVNNLPDYGDYSQLAHRSWGQTIAPVGVMLAAGFNMQAPEVSSAQKFIKHYIIAKQLSDDAHDWRADLQNGHMTAVVCLLLRGHSGEDQAGLGQYFWDHTITEVNQLIRHHLKMARTALDACGFYNDAVFKKWLARLEASCVKSEQGRADTIEFIQEFSRPALV